MNSAFEILNVCGISDVKEWIGGYKATYTDKRGNTCKVEGTFCFGPALSWYVLGHGYFVICGHDQGKIIPEEIRLNGTTHENT